MKLNCLGRLRCTASRAVRIGRRVNLQRLGRFEPNQRVKVNLIGLTIKGVAFSQNVQEALGTIIQRIAAEPPKYLVELLCLPLICPIGSRRTPEVFVMESTHAWHLHHPALARPLRSPRLGRVLGQR